MSLTLLNLPRPTKLAANPGPSYRLDDISGMAEIFGSIRTLSGKVVSPKRAMRAAFVLACIRILTEDLSALPLYIYKDTPNGPEKAVNHPVYKLLDIAPNPIQTPMELRERIVMDLLLHGNSYVLKMGESVMDGLYPLPAQGVIRRDAQLIWDFTDEATHTTGTLTAETMWRTSILSSNNFDGQAIVLLAREAIGLLLAAEEQGARLFAHGIQSDLTLSVPETLDPDQKKDLKENVLEAYSGSRNAFTPLLLEGGLTAQRIGLTAQESQYIEARNFQGQDIARIFRIPAVLLGMVGDKSATYASAEQFFQSYTKHTLNPWTVRIEQTIRRDLFSPSEQLTHTAKHDFSSLLKADTQARYSSYEIGIRSSFLSPADVRKFENLPFVEGLDSYERSVKDSPAAGTKPASTPAPNPNGLATRVAELILRREQKCLLSGRGKDVDLFYAQHAGFVEDLTGGDLDSVLAYCEMRKTSADRFSKIEYAKAIVVITELCKGDQ